MSVADVSILDVGHGNSTVVFENSETVVIDCGAKGAGLINYLRNRKISHIKAILISHADHDHIGGLMTLILSEEFSIDEVSLNGDGTKQTKIWDDLVNVLDADDRSKKIKFNVSISNGDTPLNVGDFSITTISPSKFIVGKGVGGTDRQHRKITTNSISASFLITRKGLSLVYVSGDIDKISLDEIVHTEASIKTEVLIFPHHGGDIGDGNIIEFAEELSRFVQSSVIIFSIGRNKFANPRPDVVAAVRGVAKGARIACTQLSKHCCSKVPVNAAKHLHPYFANGRYNNECCGGTFVLSIDKDNVIYSPTLETHNTFIDSNTINPLCRQ